MTSPACKYRFGVFELSTRTRELYKQGRKLKLRPQPFQVLLLLLENAGDVVTREQVRERVWTSDTFVDFEHGLNTAIKELRGVLNDSAKEPRYIETLPKLGYRLIVAVEKDEGRPVAAAVPASDAAEQIEGAAVPQGEPGPELQPQPRQGSRWATAVAAAAVVIALVFATIWIRGRTGKQGTAAVAKASGQHLMLAVLPFENLTGDATQEYFSDGMTEEMIAQLGRLDPARMSVIARTSVMRFKNSADALDQVKQQLGVQYVLEGSVRRENDRVRVTAQLIKTQDQTRVWGKEYDRELSNLLGLQAEIAGEIAREVDLNLAAPDGTAAGTEERLRPERLAAYDLYLRGRYFWNKRHEADLKLAAQIFQQAVAKDPEYARGYAGLADAYALLATYRIVPQEQAMPKARAAAQKALELDATLAEAHTSLALVVEFYDWNWSAAEQEYRRAIELDPNYATAHQWYAEELAIVGRFPEAMGEIEQARTLDPLSVIIDADYGTIQYLSRRYDAAIQRYHAVLEMEPEFPRGFGIIMPLVQERRYTEALAWLERWAAKVGPNHGWWWCYLTYVYASMGEMGKARHALEKLLALKGALRSELTVAWMSTGNKEKALEYLEADYARRTIPVFVGVDPLYDPLRGEPRFQKILQGMGLAR